jgi:hypothetical protein
LIANQAVLLEHGNNVFESVAMPPEDVQTVLKDTIDFVIAIDAVNHEIDQEKEDATFLEATRRRVQSMLSGFAEEG